MEMKEITRKVRDRLLNEKNDVFLDLDNIKNKPEQERLIRQEVKSLGIEDEEIENHVIANLIGLGRIEPLLKDKWINEIMINGQEVWIDKKGQIVKTDITFESVNEVEALLQRIVQMSGRKIDWSNPLVDAKLPDGSRVNAIIKPSADFPVITIRRFVEHSFEMNELVKQGYLSEDMAIFFNYAVKSKLNILLCGAAGSSKTTYLRTLGTLIPQDERIITIEDVKELNISHPHVIALEASNKASVYDLIINALRMRPDRVLLGECRGMETFELLQAMGTGHNGSITTAHTNNAKMDAFQRLQRAMIRSGMSDKELLSQITSAIDITVYMQRFKNGKWGITNVCEVINKNGYPEFNDLYIYDYNSRSHISCNSLTKDLTQRIKNNLEYESLPKTKVFGVPTERKVAI